MINKISDIKIGGEYFILLVKDKKFARKCIVKAIINEQIKFISDKTEINFQKLKNGKSISNNLCYFAEIGIGDTKEEAFKNYGRFNYENNSNFDITYKNS